MLIFRAKSALNAETFLVPRPFRMWARIAGYSADMLHHRCHIQHIHKIITCLYYDFIYFYIYVWMYKNGAKGLSRTNQVFLPRQKLSPKGTI